MVAGHPVTDPRDSFAEASHRVRVIRGLRADVDLHIIGARMCCEPALSRHIKKVSRIQQEKNRAAVNGDKVPKFVVF